MRLLLAKIYGYNASIDAMVIYPLYAVMFERDHLTNLQIGALFAVWSIASIIFEVPSGVLADKYPRKYVLTAVPVFLAAGFGMWLLSPNFTGYLLGFVLMGIGGALYSGAFEALVYDELKARGVEDSYTKVLGRSSALALLALVVAYVAAAPLVEYGFDTLLIVSVATCGLTVALGLSLPKAPIVADVKDDEYFSLLKQGLRDARHLPGVPGLIVVAALAGTAYGAFEEFDPLYLLDAGLDDSSIALVEAGIGVVVAIAAALAGHGRLASGRHVPKELVLAGLLLAIAAFQLNTFGIILLTAFLFTSQAAMIQASGRLQHALADTTRATVTSVAGLSTELMSILVFVGFGALAESVSRQAAFAGAGAAVALAGLMTWRNTTRNISVGSAEPQ